MKEISDTTKPSIHKYLEEPPELPKSSAAPAPTLQTLSMGETIGEFFDNSSTGLASKGLIAQWRQRRIRARALDRIWEAKTGVTEDWIKHMMETSRLRFAAAAQHAAAQCADALQSGLEAIAHRRLDTQLSNLRRVMEISHAHIESIAGMDIPEAEKLRRIVPIRQKCEAVQDRILNDSPKPVFNP